MNRTLEVCLAGFCVYFAMAACSAATDRQAFGDSAEQGDGAQPGPDQEASPGISSPVPNAMADEWHKPGSRLKIRFLRSEDGAQQFVSWVDTARDNEECSFSVHADRSQRCMPIAMAQATYFSQAGCTGPELAIIAKGSPAPSYASKAEVTGGRRFPVAAPYAGTVFYRQPFSGECQDHTTSFNSQAYDLYRLGPELPASAFVKATFQTAL